MVLKFSPEQFEAFATPVRNEWVTAAAQRLHQAYPEYFKALEVEPGDLEPLCRAVERWADGYAIAGQRDVAQLCCVASTLGHNFWLDPRFDGYVKQSVGDRNIARSKAVETLVNNAGNWLAVLWKDDTLQGFAGRMDHYIRQDAEPTTQTLQAILPGHWVLFDADVNEQLLAWLLQALPSTQMPAQRLAYVACALVHGTGWLHDPQYGVIKQEVEAGHTPYGIANTLSDIYGEIG